MTEALRISCRKVLRHSGLLIGFISDCQRKPSQKSLRLCRGLGKHEAYPIREAICYGPAMLSAVNKV